MVTTVDIARQIVIGRIERAAFGNVGKFRDLGQGLAEIKIIMAQVIDCILCAAQMNSSFCYVAATSRRKIEILRSRRDWRRR
jgi:putative component of toxin-antitoxin plasmid stabilization module